MHIGFSGRLLAVVLMCVPGAGYSQLAKQSPINPPLLNYSKLNFNQELNIYEWLYSFNYEKSWKSNLRLSVRESFQTTLQRIATRDSWKDRQNLTLNLAYPLTTKLSLQSELYSYVLSDPLAGFDNDLIHHSAVARLRYRPISELSITPEIATKWQTQVEQSDQGLGFGLSAELHDLELAGYQNQLSAFGEQDIFSERRNEDVKIRYRVSRHFYEATADTLTVFFDRLRRDNFDFAGDEVFVRSLTQTIRGIENRLSYRLTGIGTLYFRNAFTSTTFGVKNLKDVATEVAKDDQSFESDHLVRLRFQRPQWFGSLNWHYRVRSRDDRRPADVGADPFNRHATVGFDTDQTFVSLSTQGGYRFADSDSLGLSASVSKFKFETTATETRNDHDLLKWQATLSHSHSWDESLRLVWRFSAFLNHFVFISGDFSSSNNWERVFQLMPILTYAPHEGLFIRQGFTVRAKYQTFDFDDPVTSNRNTVNRQFILWNSSRLRLASSSWLEFGFNIELAEQGKLFYEQWRQRLALSWRNEEVQVMFRQQFASSLTVSVGANVFHQIRWNHRLVSGSGLEKSVRDTHVNAGPILQISYQAGRSVEVLFYGNIQTVNASGRSTERINNFDLNLNWFF